MKKQPEYLLQCQICKYLEIQHPKVLFMSDTIASLRLTIPQQIRNKKIQKRDFKTPDLLIFEPKGKYHGLFIELKNESPFKKDGTIKASQNDHLLLQQKTLNKLMVKGYIACFSWTFENTIALINNYLKLN